MNNFLKTGEYNLCFPKYPNTCGRGLCWFTVTQGIHNFTRKLSNKILLEVTSAISDCPHQESQNCWNLNVLYHLTILCFHSKCKNVLHFRRNMRKAKTDIEQVWFLLSPPHIFWHLSSSSFSFLFSLKLESFNIHWKCWYSMETNLPSMPVQYSSVC